MFEEAFRSLNPFVPKAPVLYPMKTSENLKELEKGCMGTNGLILKRTVPSDNKIAIC